MNATVSLDGILTFIDSLSLSSQNKRWLGEKLIESSEADCIAKDNGITSEMINKHFGALDDKSAEEIVRCISDSRFSSKAPLSMD